MRAQPRRHMVGRRRVPGTNPPVASMVYVANGTLTCVECDSPIPPGEPFTRGGFAGGGPRLGDVCRSCRPFEETP